MAETKSVNAKAVSTTHKQDPLRTEYHCQVSRKEIAEVVMKLSETESSNSERRPLRYVLVIDVSGSMDSRVGTGIESLLDRVKIFLDLVIQNVLQKDSIALVTFSHEVEVNFPMTKMTSDAKKRASKVVQGLQTRGGTNLEIGLMTGLQVLKKNPSKNNRDLIIVFTDGMANEGEVDPIELVKIYRKAHGSINKSSCVPISAFTIGQYTPYLLEQIASHLGSEAFYWLNENEEFEADMLIPVFLREETRVSDVNIQITTLEDIKVHQGNIFQKHLQEASDKSLVYFVHSIPQDITKSIPFTLLLPQHKLEELDGKPIADVRITYLDSKLKKREINDFILLSTKTLREIENAPKTSKGDIMDETSAFSTIKNKLSCSWPSAQNSLANVATVKCRVISATAIRNALDHILKNDLQGQVRTIQEAILEVNTLKKTYVSMLGDSGSYAKLVIHETCDWTAKLKFGETITAHGRLFAMESSMATEMPTAKGVFDPKGKHPFLPAKIEKKLRRFEKIIQTTKKKRQEQSFQTSSVFKAQNVVVSESLRDKRVGPRQETFSELITRCGGRPVPNVRTVYNDTFLVCSQKDLERGSVLVQDSTRAQIPIVKEQYIYDCVREKRILELKNYLLNDGKTRQSVS